MLLISFAYHLKQRFINKQYIYYICKVFYC